MGRLSKVFGFGAAVWPGIAKLVEECGELLQVCGKLMMTDGEKIEHWDGTNLRECITKEISDLHAALWFVVEHNFTPDEFLMFTQRSMQKRALYEQWHMEELAKQPVSNVAIVGLPVVSATAGDPYRTATLVDQCLHGLTFDEEIARAEKLTVEQVRVRWPRLFGPCPLGCGYSGIAYASTAHYVYGDW